MNDKPVSGSGLDDLLTPTLQDQCAPLAAEKPWRVQSQFYIAFFGGILPLTVIAYLNAKKLGLSTSMRNRIILLGVVALAVAMVGTGLYLHSKGIGDLSHAIRNSAVRRTLRWGPRLAAILLYLPLRRIQAPADRLYQFNSDEEDSYASLWKAGILAVLVLGTLQSFAFSILIPLLF